MSAFFSKRHGGMDMGGMGSSAGGASFFASSGTLLWFDGWTPTSSGTTFAACLGLFLLAAFSRLLGAVRRHADRAWARRSVEMMAERYGSTPYRTFTAPELKRDSSSSSISGAKEAQETDKIFVETSSVLMVQRPNGVGRSTPPFIAAHDVPRGMLQAVQTGLGYFLMLAVMTMNAYYFVAVVLGVGFGEMLFGRYGVHGADGM